MPAGDRIDRQAIGHEEDLANEGHIRTVLERAPLVETPMIYAGNYAATYGGSGSYVNANRDLGGNQASAGSSVVISTGAGIDRYATVRFDFGGRRLGLHLGVDSWTDLSLITVFVDGAPYALTAAHLDWKLATNVQLDNDTLRVLVAEDLPDGFHQCEIHFAGTAAGVKGYTLYGVLTEGDKARLGWPLTVTACGVYTFASATPVALSTMCNRNASLKLLRKVSLHNTTAAAIVVTATYNSVEVWGASIAAYSNAEFDPGLPMPQVSLTAATALTFTAAAGITALVLGIC